MCCLLSSSNRPLIGSDALTHWWRNWVSQNFSGGGGECPRKHCKKSQRKNSNTTLVPEQCYCLVKEQVGRWTELGLVLRQKEIGRDLHEWRQAGRGREGPCCLCIQNQWGNQAAMCSHDPQGREPWSITLEHGFGLGSLGVENHRSCLSGKPQEETKLPVTTQKQADLENHKVPPKRH